LKAPTSGARRATRSRAWALDWRGPKPFDWRALLDYALLPRQHDGLSVLREGPGRAGVLAPVIMLTGQGDEELAVEIIESGASD